MQGHLLTRRDSHLPSLFPIPSGNPQPAMIHGWGKLVPSGFVIAQLDRFQQHLVIITVRLPVEQPSLYQDGF
jgi:hypothetical protein